MEIIHTDKDIIVCVKPAGVLSTDEEGGLPSLLRQALGDEKADVRTVHRLDRVVSGLMVLARGSKNASALSEQVRGDSFSKEYLGVIHGEPEAENGTLRDLLLRNKAERKTYVVTEPGKGVQEAVLDYKVLDRRCGMSLVRIVLRTGRTHQIRAQFSSRGLPLVGDRKYSSLNDECSIALWSHRIGFKHPSSGERMEFCLAPPREYPWNEFEIKG